MKIVSYVFLHFFFIAVAAHADLDWGGGVTQFKDEAGMNLTAETGCAVLLSVAAGEVIDVENFIPQNPEDLITPGTLLVDGINVNRVLASSYGFYSGYLLNSAVTDLSVLEQQNLGVLPSEALYVLVWDTNTFLNDMPTDGSYFILVPLYEEGENALQAESYGDGVPVFAEVIYPDNTVRVSELTEIALYGGFNAVSGFLEWNEFTYALTSVTVEQAAEADSNGDGRSNYEEYVFADRPQVRAYAGAIRSPPVAGAVEVRLIVRANDPSLNYLVEVSDDLKTWNSCALEFLNNQWTCADEAIEVSSSAYEGNGIWSISVVNNLASQSASFFKFSIVGNEI